MKKMKHFDILNIYKLNFCQILNIMFQVKTNSIPETLQNKFKYFIKPNIFLGLLNLQYRHVDHDVGISILTNF